MLVCSVLRALYKTVQLITFIKIKNGEVDLSTDPQTRMKLEVSIPKRQFE